MWLVITGSWVLGIVFVVFIGLMLVVSFVFIPLMRHNHEVNRDMRLINELEIFLAYQRASRYTTKAKLEEEDTRVGSTEEVIINGVIRASKFQMRDNESRGALEFLERPGVRIEYGEDEKRFTVHVVPIPPLPSKYYCYRADETGQIRKAPVKQEGESCPIDAPVYREPRKLDSFQRTPLIYAAASGQLSVVESLIAQGVDIQAQDRDGWTPLMYATAANNGMVVDTLLELGADVEAIKVQKISYPKRSRTRTALMRESSAGHIGMVKRLLHMDAVVDVVDGDGRTALMLAAMEGHTAIVIALLKNGAEINKKDQDGWTPLMSAALGGYTDTVQELINQGADVKARNDSGWTALMGAVFRGHSDTAQRLLELDADINDVVLKKIPVSINGPSLSTARSLNPPKTLLILAVEEGHLDTVEVLLDAGMNVMTKDDNGGALLNAAEVRGHSAIVEVLSKKRAEENF